MSADWYYKVNNVETGPLSSTELRRHAAEGNVPHDSFVRQGAEGRWVAAPKVKGLFTSGEYGLLTRDEAIAIALQVASETPGSRPIESVGEAFTVDAGQTWGIHLNPESIECWPGVIAFDTPGTIFVCVCGKSGKGTVIPHRI